MSKDKVKEKISQIIDQLVPENRLFLLAQARLTLNAELAVKRQYGLLPKSIPAQPQEAAVV
jgi:hypothetical protein